MNMANETLNQDIIVPDEIVLLPGWCGEDEIFWNSSFWHQDQPHFSQCFSLTTWSLPPVVVFWLIFPFALFRVHKSVTRSSPLGALFVSKAILLVLLSVLALIDLITNLLNEERRMTVALVDASFRLVTFLVAVCLSHLQRMKGIITSPIHWMFFGTFCISSIVPFYVVVKNGIEVAETLSTLPSISTLLSIALILVSFILNFFVEPLPKYEEPSADPKSGHPTPELTASFFSKITFAWFTGLAWAGFKRDLTFQELWDLMPELRTVNTSVLFHQKWNESSARVKAVTEVNGHNQVAFETKANGVEFKPQQSEEDDSWKSILSVLISVFGFSFFTGSLLKLVHDLMIFISPIVLKLIIQFAKGDDSMWRGISYCVLLLFTTTAQSIILAAYFYKMYLIGMKIRSSMTNAVYKKSLRTSVTSRDDSTSGELVNLMSVDIQRIVDLMPYVNMIWSAPLQIAGSIYFLWQQLGPSVLAGLLVMVLLIPVNGLVAAKSRQFQMRQMKKKDERVKMMNEILQGIKILKLYAWESSFQDLITQIRAKEIDILTKMGYLAAGTSFVWSCAPFLVSLVSFAVFVLVDENNVLDSEKAFVSLSLFNILRFPLSMLPMMITMAVQASVSVKRLNKFMNSEEVKSDVNYEKTNPDTDGDAIEVEKASFAWKEGQKPVLNDITMNVKTGSLVAVVGTVGAGKSSLVSSLVGEMRKLQGTVTVRGSIALVPQQAWVQNATLKDNILFGKPYEEEMYKKVLDACALKADLEVLPGGDMTEIGEKGINLSGGQKQRVSLARAMYSQSELYLFDDPLSAVDSHVGKHIFENVIGPNGSLAKTTRVLVTHGMTFLPKVDLIIVIKDGGISEMGTYSELLARKGAFAEILVQFLSEEAEEVAGEEADEVSDLKMAVEQALGKDEYEKKMARCRTESENQTDKVSIASAKSNDDSSTNLVSSTRGSSPRKRVLTNQSSVKSQDSGKEGTPDSKATATASAPAAAEEKKTNQKQYEDEKTGTGKVNARIYIYYVFNMGVWLTSTCVLCYTGYQVCSALSSIWLSKWSDEAGANQSNSDRDMYLGIYGGLGIGQALFAVLGSIFLYKATLSGAKNLHNLVLTNIMRSPMSFFDTTPQGRILNRFGKDIDVLDTTMSMILRGWITCLLAVISTFLIITYTTPFFLLPISVVLVCYWVVQRVYVASSRQLKRLESVTRSPIYSHFGETISGVETIRAYNLQGMFTTESERRLDENMKALYPSNVANRWLAVRLETVGNIIIFCSALFAVLGRGEISPGLVGLSVSYALSVTQTLNWLVRMASEVETNIVAVERLQEYAQTEQEAAWEIEGREKKFNPASGAIEFKNYSTRYRSGLNLVLNDISLVINGGERVGIVGRTGAGKSSLTQALFRLIEPANGTIIIDGIDICSLGLHELRSKLSIIPQEPVLFSGNLRLNLDPFGESSEEELLKALKLAHLGEFYDSLENGLEHKISEGGTNLSVGQRQLVCLARALLRKAKILVLDEATAAVDMETDEVIQETIRKEFTNTTILTIAHRLNTIMDYNKIVVLANGSVTECDTPENLLTNKSSAFYQMCAEAGLA